MDLRYNDKECIKKTNETLKEIGINKTLDSLYDEYCDGKINQKLKKYLLDNGMINLNPYHIYNQYYYWNGELN